MENQEKIAKIIEKTGVSEETAKRALEENGYDILDAVIALGNEGKTQKVPEYHAEDPSGGQDFSAGASGWNRNDAQEEPEETKAEGNDAVDGTFREITVDREAFEKENSTRTDRRNDSAQRFANSVKRLLVTLSKAMFCVQRKDEEILSVPVIVLVLALIFAFWFVVPVLVVGLFADCRYHVEGAKKVTVDFNEMMDMVSKEARNIKNDLKDRKK